LRLIHFKTNCLDERLRQALPCCESASCGTSYQFFPVSIDTVQWTCTDNGQLYAVPDYITSTQYQADGQTKRIEYDNGVVSEFFYSPERRWLTRVRHIRGLPSCLPSSSTRYTPATTPAASRPSTAAAADDWSYAYKELDWLFFIIGTPWRSAMPSPWRGVHRSAQADLERADDTGRFEEDFHSTV
jgi:hypothetical protein